MNPEDKRQAIVAAATTQFSRYGFKRTSVEDVAREAGVAKGTIYLYFATKEAIFGAVCEDVCTKMLDGAKKAAAGRAAVATKLAKVLHAKYGLMLALVDSSPHAAELMDSSNSLATAMLAETERALQEIIASLLRDADGRGEIALARAGLSASAAAALAIRAAIGSTSAVPDGVVPDDAELRARLGRLAKILVRGLGG